MFLERSLKPSTGRCPCRCNRDGLEALVFERRGIRREPSRIQAATAALREKKTRIPTLSTSKPDSLLVSDSQFSCVHPEQVCPGSDKKAIQKRKGGNPRKRRLLVSGLCGGRGGKGARGKGGGERGGGGSMSFLPKRRARRRHRRGRQGQRDHRRGEDAHGASPGTWQGEAFAFARWGRLKELLRFPEDTLTKGLLLGFRVLLELVPPGM